MLRLFVLIMLLLTFVFASVSAQVLEVSPEKLNFGYVTIDETDSLALTIRNTGEWDWIWGDMRIIGSDIVQFEIHIPEALAARAAISAIHNAVIMYNQDYGEDPSSVEELIRLIYVEIDEEILMQWSFTLIGSNPVTQIEAVSTFEMMRGAGHVVLYDIGSDHFSGYGMNFNYAIFDLRAEVEHLFWMLFLPDEEQEFEACLTIFLSDSSQEEHDTLYVNMTGNGVLSIKDNLDETVPASFIINRIYPNPFNSQSIITYVTPRDAYVKLNLYDITGRYIRQLTSEWASAGRHQLVINGKDLAAGVYVVRFEAGGMEFERKIQLVK